MDPDLRGSSMPAQHPVGSSAPAQPAKERAMAFSATASAGTKSDLNVVLLIDVLLVLLIIFMVTAPLISFEEPVDLARGDVKPKPLPPDPIRLRIDPGGALYWDNLPLPKMALAASLQIETLGRSVDDQPMLEIQASPEVDYQQLAEVLTTAKNVGMSKIGFVDEH